MITECAALIKTHDYRPGRALEYPATVISSRGEAPDVFPVCSLSLPPELRITSRRFLASSCRPRSSRPPRSSCPLNDMGDARESAYGSLIARVGDSRKPRDSARYFRSSVVTYERPNMNGEYPRG